MEDLIDYLNPLSYMTLEEYLAWWNWVFATLFQGVVARVLAMTCLASAFWYGAYKQRLAVGIFFYALTILLAYVSSFARFFGVG